MGSVVEGRATRIAGRVQERQVLGEAILGASNGSPCAVFVHGEAGVGKTRLVAQASTDAEAEGFTVLWGRCVHFGAGSSPYLPIISALERWLAGATEEDRGRLIDEVPGLGELLPSLGGGTGVDAAGRLLTVIDAAVDKIARLAPTVLVIDDMQWADVSSLDVLAYLVTGFRGQRLALLTTYRDEQLPDGHPLHGWIADVLRAPLVIDLPLRRLSYDETSEQIQLLTGIVPRTRLLDDVMAKSHGNCYLTELLVRGLAPESSRLPTGLPDALRSALLAAWHRLSERTRRVVTLLAVGGRPLVFADLERVLAAQDVAPREVAEALSEAIKAGVVQTDSSGEFWFRHPLLAEVLTDTLLPGEEKPLHALFAEALAGEDRRGHKLRADLALHCERADRFDEAFGHYLAAAAEAERVQGYPEQMHDLLSAARLWDRVSAQTRRDAGVGSEARLWSDVAFVARGAGDTDQAYAAIDHARRIVDAAAEPLVASRVHQMWGEIATFSGRVAAQPLEAFRTSVALAADFPDSVEYARALAALSEAEVWSGDREAAVRDAEAAVTASERAGELQTRSLALQARSLARVNEPSGVVDAEAAYRLALESGDGGNIALACITRGNYYEEQGRLREAADLYRHSVEGGFGGRAGLHMLHATYAGYYLMMLGELSAARAMLREPLAARAVGSAGLQARSIAAQVALRQGRMEAAEAHLSRARDIASDFVRHTGMHGVSAYAEYLIARGRPREALVLLLEELEPHGRAEPRYGDLLLTYGAHAAADLAVLARDTGDAEAADEAAGMLERLVKRRATVPREPFEPYDERDLVQPAVRAFFAAEQARCLDERDRLAELWRSAAEACAAGQLAWHEALARLGHAQALLRDRARRSDSAAALRAAHTIAVRIGAQPLLHAVEAAAASARISLVPPVVPPPEAAVSNGLSRLTRRELEVLTHLLAGRSYTEIARALFISDKTVSVHVSNLLRKTGTSSRAEAAEFARRHGLGQS